MAPLTRATAPRPASAAVPAPRPPPTPPAARRRRQGIPAPPGRAASGRPEEEPQEGPGAAATPGFGAQRQGGLPAQHGPGRKRRREAARDGSPPARKARVTPAASSLPPPAPSCSPMPREVNRSVTRSFSKLKKSTQANADMANESTTAPAHPAAPRARKARATAPSQPPLDPVSSPFPASATIKNPASKVNRPITRSISQSAWANPSVANVDTDTTDMRTRTDDIQSLRRRLIVSESKVVKEKDNVRRGLQKIRRKDAQLLEIKKRYCTNLERALETIDFLRDARDALLKVKAEKEAEIQELKVQKQAEVQKVVHKETEAQKVIKENIRLLCIVDKEEAQLQAMSEHCKLLALKNTTTNAADAVR